MIYWSQHKRYCAIQQIWFFLCVLMYCVKQVVCVYIEFKIFCHNSNFLWVPLSGVLSLCGTIVILTYTVFQQISIRDLLVHSCHVEVDDYADVIVYDQCTENPARLTEDNFLSVLLDKLTDAFDTVALLRGEAIFRL